MSDSTRITTWIAKETDDILQPLRRMKNVKKIIIGSRGSMLKKTGTYARKDLEDFLGKKVYLELFVKTIPKWRAKEKYLADFGFHEFE